VSGDVKPDLAFSLAKGRNDESPLTGDNSIVAKEHKLNDSCLDEHVTDQSAMQTKVSRDLSLSVAPSNEPDHVKAMSLIAMEVVDADRNAVHSADKVNVSNGRSTTPVSIQSLTADESLPFMPLLDKSDEPRRAGESDGIDGRVGTVQEERSVSHIIPRIEKRPRCAEIETSHDSMLSLHLEDIFDTDEPPCAVKEDASTCCPSSCQYRRR
jgi:hypothetical protein